MTSQLYNSIDQSLSDLLKIYSLNHLLTQDHERLITQFYSISYYHPNIDRDRAEQLLKTKYFQSKSNGLFLIRNCMTSAKDFSLTLIYNDRCYHYKIKHIYDIFFSIGIDFILTFHFY